MGNHTTPSFQELREITLLVHECCELGTDANAWRSHLAAGLRRQLNADAVVLHTATGISPMTLGRLPEILSFVQSGLAESALKVFDAYASEHKPSDCPLEVALSERVRPGGLLTGREQDLVERRTWDRASLFQSYIRPMGFDALLGSRFVSPAGPAHSIMLHRGNDLGRFTERERALLDYCFRQVTSLLGTRLSDNDEPSVIDRLSRRERDVLRLFLREHSDQNVATRLGISMHTVRDYAKALNRKFAVQSREQLVIRALHLLPLLDKDRLSHTENLAT